MSRRRARIKSRLRRRLLGWLLPGQRSKLNTPGYTPLVVVVPIPSGLLRADSRADRAEVCMYAGEAARLVAAQATRARVGTSAVRAPRSPEEQFAAVAVEPPFNFTTKR